MTFSLCTLSLHTRIYHSEVSPPVHCVDISTQRQQPLQQFLAVNC